VLGDDGAEWNMGTQTFYFHYYDDVLLLCTSEELVERVTRAVAERVTGAVMSDLVGKGLKISPKSRTTPSRTFTWLGKEFDTTDRTITSTRPTLLSLTGLCLLVY
jgi:hypothetical protein